MPRTAISTRLPEATIEFDNAKGGRTTKHFKDANDAKRFFTAKDKSGKSPKVIGEAAGDVAPEPADKPAKPKRPRKTAADKPAATSAAETTPSDAAAERKPAKVSANARAVTRIAGEVIAKHGLEVGITQEMVDEVAELAGRSNPHQDWFNLRNAWHAINGYLAAKQ